MDWFDVEDSGLVVRLAVFDDFVELADRIGEVRSRDALALYFDGGRAYGDARIFVTDSGAFPIPMYVPQPGILVGSLGLVTPSIGNPRFHAFDLDDEGQLSIVGQSPLEISYEAFVRREKVSALDSYLRSLRGLQA